MTVTNTFHPLGRFGVYFDDRLIDTTTFLRRIQKALPYLANTFTTKVIDGASRKEVQVKIIGRVKEGKPEKISVIYNNLIRGLTERQIRPRKVTQLKGEYLIYRMKKDVLNCMDVLEDLKSLEEETAEEFLQEHEAESNVLLNKEKALPQVVHANVVHFSPQSKKNIQSALYKV